LDIQIPLTDEVAFTAAVNAETTLSSMAAGDSDGVLEEMSQRLENDIPGGISSVSSPIVEVHAVLTVIIDEASDDMDSLISVITAKAPSPEQISDNLSDLKGSPMAVTVTSSVVYHSSPPPPPTQGNSPNGGTIDSLIESAVGVTASISDQPHFVVLISVVGFVVFVFIIVIMYLTYRRVRSYGVDKSGLTKKQNLNFVSSFAWLHTDEDEQTDRNWMPTSRRWNPNGTTSSLQHKRILSVRQHAPVENESSEMRRNLAAMRVERARRRSMDEGSPIHHMRTPTTHSSELPYGERRSHRATSSGSVARAHSSTFDSPRRAYRPQGTSTTQHVERIDLPSRGSSIQYRI
jgi:hypothetical protein